MVTALILPMDHHWISGWISSVPAGWLNPTAGSSAKWFIRLSAAFLNRYHGRNTGFPTFACPARDDRF